MTGVLHLPECLIGQAVNVKLFERGNQREKHGRGENGCDEEPRDHSLQLAEPKFLQEFQWRFMKALNQFRNGKLATGT